MGKLFVGIQTAEIASSVKFRCASNMWVKETDLLSMMMIYNIFVSYAVYDISKWLFNPSSKVQSEQMINI